MIDRTTVLTWLRQPTTIAGLAALLGDAVVALTGAASWRVELPLALGSLVAVALPDNTTATALAVRTLRDVLAAVATRDPATIEAAVADAEALLASVTAKP